MKLSEQLIGKKVTFRAHHDAFPSMFVAGTILSVAPIKHSKSEVEYTVKDTDDTIATFWATKHMIQSLLDTKEYVSDSFASRESKFVYIK